MEPSLLSISMTNLELMKIPVIIIPYLPLFIVLAIKTPARNGAVFTHSTPVCLPVKMNAVSVATVRNEIRSAEFPSDDTLLNILPGQRERKFAADRPAD